MSQLNLYNIFGSLEESCNRYLLLSFVSNMSQDKQFKIRVAKQHILFAKQILRINIYSSTTYVLTLQYYLKQRRGLIQHIILKSITQPMFSWTT